MACSQSRAILPCWALCILLQLSCSQSDNAQPQVYASTRVEEHIRSIPKYTVFQFSGLACSSRKVFATSNIGLFEIQDGKIQALFQWNRSDPVVEGPWPNKADGSFFIQDVPANRLLRFKDSRWNVCSFPRLPAGEFSRGDTLQGFKGFSGENAFWIVGAKHLWRWNSEQSQWDLQSTPPSKEGIVALIPLKNSVAAISRSDPDTTGTSGRTKEDEFKSDVVHQLTNGVWSEVPSGDGKFITKDVVSSADKGFVLTRAGSILEFKEGKISYLPMPGSSEAICMTSGGTLLASICGFGIYEYDHSWTRKYKYPFGSDEGDHSAFIIEESGSIFLATSAIPTISKTTGTTSMWISKGDKLERISIGDPK